MALEEASTRTTRRPSILETISSSIILPMQSPTSPATSSPLKWIQPFPPTPAWHQRTASRNSRRKTKVFTKVESNCGENGLDEVQSTTIPAVGFTKVSPHRAAMPYTTVDKIAEVGSDGGNVSSSGITPYSTIEQVGAHVLDSSDRRPGNGQKPSDKPGSDKIDSAPTAVGKPTATVAPLQQEQNLTTMSSDTTDPHRRNEVVDSSRASIEMPDNCVTAADDERADGLKADPQTEHHSRDNGTGSKGSLPSGYVSWAPKGLVFMKLTACVIRWAQLKQKSQL